MSGIPRGERRIAPVAVASLLAVALLAGCDAPRERELASVPARLVCMVNDRYFGVDQIPVTIEDRTYYGCCAGCEKTIRENHAVRTAVDPVTGTAVDKATAAVGAFPDGSVRYFENEGNLERYRIVTQRRAG